MAENTATGAWHSLDDIVDKFEELVIGLHHPLNDKMMKVINSITDSKQVPSVKRYIRLAYESGFISLEEIDFYNDVISSNNSLLHSSHQSVIHRKMVNYINKSTK